MLSFIESGVFIYVLAAIAGVGIITKLVSAVRYSKLENQAEDVSTARDTYIRLWKNKFENAYRINKGMNDPELFVERCVNQCKLLGIQLSKWDRLNRVLCSICLVICGVVVTTEVRGGVETAVTLGHFLTSLSICSLMVFIEVFCETGEKRHRIGLNLTDYFVNTLSHRLQLGVETATAEPETTAKRGLREQVAELKAEKKAKAEIAHEEAQRDQERELLLRESLERIAASREPADEDRREKRSRSRRDEDARLIEEILREYLR